jgi:hypothetical protein
MQPFHLAPSLADIALALRVLIVATLACGAGFLAGARRLETAFFAGWGLASLIFVTLGTLTSIDLSLAALVGAVLGGVGLVVRLRHGASFWNEPSCSWHVLVIGAPIIALTLSMGIVGWDDLAMWAPNLLHLCRTLHFPSLLHPGSASAMPGYPYGLALPGFCVHLLGQGLAPEESGQLLRVSVIWNALALLAAGAALANRMAAQTMAGQPYRMRHALWMCAALGVLLEGFANPTFVSKITFTEMGDSSSGAGLALLLGQLFDLACVSSDAARRRRLLIETAFIAAAVTFIRQENIVLIGLLVASAGLGLALFRSHDRLRRLAELGATLALPFYLWIVWAHYVNTQIPGGNHSLLPLAQWHWAVFGDTLRSAARVFMAKSGYAIMGCVLAALFLRHLALRFRRGRAAGAPVGARAQAELITAVTGLTFGNIAFLLFCYLATSFSLFEAKTAITFWRFIGQTGQAEMLALGCVVAAVRPSALRISPRAAIAAAAAVFMLPLAALATPFTLRSDIGSAVPSLESVGIDISHIVPPGRPITLIDLAGNGFAPVVVKFALQNFAGDEWPLRVEAEPRGIAPRAAATLRPEASGYYWLAEGAPNMPQIFGQPTRAGCSYLFSVSGAQVTLVRTWDVSRFRWGTDLYDEKLSGPADCTPLTSQKLASVR